MLTAISGFDTREHFLNVGKTIRKDCYASVKSRDKGDKSGWGNSVQSWFCQAGSGRVENSGNGAGQPLGSAVRQRERHHPLFARKAKDGASTSVLRLDSDCFSKARAPRSRAARVFVVAGMRFRTARIFTVDSDAKDEENLAQLRSSVA